MFKCFGIDVRWVEVFFHGVDIKCVGVVDTYIYIRIHIYIYISAQEYVLCRYTLGAVE